jgi:hypothetical protein
MDALRDPQRAFWGEGGGGPAGENFEWLRGSSARFCKATNYGPLLHPPPIKQSVCQVSHSSAPIRLETSIKSARLTLVPLIQPFSLVIKDFCAAISDTTR